MQKPRVRRGCPLEWRRPRRRRCCHDASPLPWSLFDNPAAGAVAAICDRRFYNARISANIVRRYSKPDKKRRDEWTGATIDRRYILHDGKVTRVLDDDLKNRNLKILLCLAASLVLVADLAVGQTTTRTLSPPAGADELTLRLWSVYGAIFAAGGGATPPPAVIFDNEEAVTTWQSGVPTERQTKGKLTIELQVPALEALERAREELRPQRLKITPQARTAARRSYADTVRLWQVRVHAGLRHWAAKKRITQKEARRIRALPPAEQIPEILRLEDSGLFFSSNLSKSILTSAAPPGASQHLAMLALDIKEHGHRKVRDALARHGWFQTVPLDLAHFGYLGYREEELPTQGLKPVTKGSRVYWVPDWPVAPAADAPAQAASNPE